MTVQKIFPVAALCSVSFLMLAGVPVLAEGLFNNGQGSSITFLKPPQKGGSNIATMQIPDEVLSLVEDADAKAFLTATKFDVTRPNPGTNSYLVTLSGADVPLAGDALSEATRLSLPETLDVVSARILVGLDKPWSKLAAQNKTLKARSITVESLRLVWGDIALSGTGTLEMQDDGTYAGALALQVTDWEKVLKLDFLNEAQRGSLQQVLAALSKGQPDISLPLKVVKSRLMVGPIVVGTIPPLELP